MQFYTVVNNELNIGGISAKELIREYGSPLYVYDETVIRDRYKKLYNSIPYDHKKIYYAMKTNGNLNILKVLKDEGAYIDAVSRGEVAAAIKAGFAGSRILFTGINLTKEDMEFASKNNVMMSIGSLCNLELYGSLYPNTAVSIRVNPDFGAGHHDHVITGGRKSKFGIFYSKSFQGDINKTKEIIKKYNLKLAGVQAHIGSGILEEQKFIELMQIILGLAVEFPGLDFVDFGGGIGVPYHPDEKDFDLEKFGKHAAEKMKDISAKYGRELTMAIEPGRFLSAESGYLLATVTDVKDNPDYTFVGLNTGFNHLIRPMAYGSYHPIVNASRVEGEKKNVVVTGYLCESGDVFTRTEQGIGPRAITEPQLGDILAIINAGAYGFAMSSNYNYQPRPAEVLVSNGKARLIRRRETLEDMISTME